MGEVRCGSAAAPADGPWTRRGAPTPSAAPMIVQGPGGARVQFPAGTDPATVNSVMRQNFSPPASGANVAPPLWPQGKPVTQAVQPQWMQSPPVAPSGNDDRPWLDYAPPAIPATGNDDKPWLDYAPSPSPDDATRAAYDALPWYRKIPQAADDTARLVANGATLGYADKLAAAVPAAFGSGDYNSNLAAERQASQAAAEGGRSPVRPSRGQTFSP